MTTRKSNTVSAEVEQMLQSCTKQFQPKDGPEKRQVIVASTIGGMARHQELLRQTIQAGDANQAALIGFRLGVTYGISLFAPAASKEIMRQVGKAKQKSDTSTKAAEDRDRVNLLVNRGGMKRADAIRQVAKERRISVREMQRRCKQERQD